MECITAAGCTDGRGVKEVVIARDGGIRLVAGSTRTAFVVSSDIVRLASPAWRAMLSPEYGFIESRSDSIPLPDDEAEALRIVLLIAHLRFRDLPETMKLDDIYSLAVLCDKYDMVGLVEPFLGRWVRQDMPISRLPGPEKWLFIAWTFGLDHLFISVVDFLVSNLHDRGDDIYGLGEGAIMGDVRPAAVIESIRSVRRHVIADMLRICYKYTSSFHRGRRCKRAVHADERARCDAAVSSSFRLQLKSLGLWPHRSDASELDYSARVLRTKLQEFKVDQIAPDHQRCNFVQTFHESIERAYRSGNFADSHTRHTFFRDTASGVRDDTDDKHFTAMFLRKLRLHTHHTPSFKLPASSSDESEVEIMDEPPAIFACKRPRLSGKRLLDG